ncbi:MAG TPA: PqqD family protein [Ktedonobacterales bacterium]|nr:PqqD family protein [Ktedonobacterales bacterium]
MRPDTYLRINSPAVIHETLDGEVVIINLDSGTYYSLDATGAAIWERIGPQANIERIAAELAAQSDAPPAEATATVLAFCEELAREGLVVEAAAEDAAELDAPPAVGGERTAVFPVPALQKFTDMQDLLLLDPVHEVAEAGWPHRKPGAR